MMPIHLEGSHRPRPRSARTLYCDGAHDAAFRPAVDLELSHWVPNLTPARYKADTSTGICLRFAADGSHLAQYQLAVNNHVDVDGVLALFVLSHPELALAHQVQLVQAAEMGDFQGWGEPPAQRLYQALVLLLHDPADAQADPLERCERAFALVRAALEGAPLPQAAAGIAALQRSLALLQSDQIERVALGARAVHFRVPAHVAAPDLARALAVPRFDADLAAPVLLLPQARAKHDAQCLQLISVQAGEGWFHDLLYPGYSWAETPDRWRPPGLLPGDGHYRLDHTPLHRAAAELNRAETRPGRWLLAESMSVFGGLAGRGFPVVLSLLHEGRAAASALSPPRVAQALAAMWESAAWA